MHTTDNSQTIVDKNLYIENHFITQKYANFFFRFG